MRIDGLHTPVNIIERYINEHSLPLEPVNFIILSLDYNIDPSFALATWILETGNGSSMMWTQNNNPAGIKCGEDYCSYPSKDAGLARMFNLLNLYTTGSISWIGQRNTIRDIREAWNPESEDCWKIYEIMLQIAAEGVQGA